MDRRLFLKTTGLGAAALAFGRGACAAPPRKPNIIVILADDLGWGELGVQGCRDIPTPNIDSIATGGVRFSDAYVSCPVCAPTRAGLMTGRYQQRFGFETNPGPEAQADPSFGLPLDQVTIAERLKGFGYATGAVGKWHLGYQPQFHPTRRGFDEFFGFLGGANGYLSDKRSGDILRGTEVVEEPEYLTDAFGREAVAFIDKHAAAPFFLYLPFNAVHNPLQATDEYLQRFADIEDSKRRTYAAMTAAMDDNVGKVLEALRAHALQDDTLVVFISDNGGPTPQTTSSNGPLKGFKGQTYEGGIRVPMMARWPGHLPAGQVCDHPVIALDIHPTAVAAAGEAVSPDWKLDGVDLLPFVTGGAAGQPHEMLLWRFQQHSAIRQGEWKLVRGPQSQAWELYNLQDDIGEQRDLAPEQPDRAKAMEAAWGAWNAELMDPQWKGRIGRAQQRPGQGRVDRRFKQLDKDGDGKLTATELNRPRIFRQMDTNGDGAVTEEEAAAYYAKRGQGGGG